MSSSGSIEELARLLSEEKRLDEKLQETQAVLTSVKKKISESLVTPYIHQKSESPVKVDESLVQQEQSFERLLQALVDMKQEIQARIRPLEEEIVQVNIKNLNESRQNQRNKLDDALDSLDHRILECREIIETTQKIHLELSDLNEKLTRLGAAPLAAKNSPRNGDIFDFIRQRIEHLRLQGKL
ncbi:MAG: hypothetical protein GTO40_29420 [Deltaproteobacteria bacterium]|nr:hypothetical protein [Deltaproteobacteria bacterium]